MFSSRTLAPDRTLGSSASLRSALVVVGLVLTAASGSEASPAGGPTPTSPAGASTPTSAAAPAGALAPSSSAPAVQAGTKPCLTSPVHRQFDFWLGRWEVTSQGRVVGTNHIQAILDGCGLAESWVSASGTTGQSLNWVDPRSGDWRQQWVDGQGGTITYQGRFRSGVMQFEGENVSRDGTSETSRMTFSPLPDGQVRQLIEQSRDGGQTWYVWFDGMYRRLD